jgi:hypothetical protein
VNTVRLCLICLILGSCAGCSQGTQPSRHIYVETNGYIGEALINCSGTTDKDVTVSLDADGVATTPCPGEKSQIRIEEGHKLSYPTDVQWTNSTEGEPDSVSIGIQASRALGY